MTEGDIINALDDMITAAHKKAKTADYLTQMDLELAAKKIRDGKNAYRWLLTQGIRTEVSE